MRHARHTTLPGTDLRVSPFCLGTGGFGSDLPREQSFALLDAFAERGGNFVDSAHIYAAWLPGGVGASERTIGAWIKARGMRREFVIGTKGGHPDLATMQRSRLSPHEITQDLTESLDRLQTDMVDLYWLHRDDPAVPVGEIMAALNEHVRAGRIRALGASNWSTTRISEANAYAQMHGLAGFCASQIGWSLARVNPALQGESGILYMDEPTWAFHQQSGLPVIPFSSQACGFFSGKYAPPAEADAPAGPGQNPHVLRAYYNEENFRRLGRAQALATRHGVTANEIALAYLMHQPFPVIPIIGPRTGEQLRASLRASDLQLSQAELDEIDGVR